jgi:uncharacterized protein with HEPN domain
MLDAAKEAITFSKNKNRSDLYANRMLTLSIVKSIEIIGEAASTVTKQFREKHKEIPWANIVAMRNRLIHVYFDIDLDRVWDTVTDDLPPLIATLENAISKESEE